MGRKVKQHIHNCYICGKDFKDGDEGWEMGNQVWCNECTEKVENEEIEYPDQP